MGLFERKGRGQWVITSYKKIDPITVQGERVSDDGAKTEIAPKIKRKILLLTREEKEVFDLLIGVQTGCLGGSNSSRFTSQGIFDLLTINEIAEKGEGVWGDLRLKLLSAQIIEAKGTGTRGEIFDLDEDLLLEYLTDEGLIKITIWQEERIKKSFNKEILNFRIW